MATIGQAVTFENASMEIANDWNNDLA